MSEKTEEVKKEKDLKKGDQCLVEYMEDILPTKDEAEMEIEFEEEDAEVELKNFLAGDKTRKNSKKRCLNGLDVDFVFKHPEQGYFLFEFLLCHERQSVNPHKSHPNNYWTNNNTDVDGENKPPSGNAMKFMRLFDMKKDLERPEDAKYKGDPGMKAHLLLVNYARKGTEHEDKARIIAMTDYRESSGIPKKKEVTWEISKEQLAKVFRGINRECGTYSSK